MNALLEDARWKACLSAFRLDRFRLGELTPAESAEVQAHLATCIKCRTAAEWLAAEEAKDRAQALPLRRPGKRPSPTVAIAVFAAALAAVGLLALQPEGLRTKGASASVGMYVQHGQAVRRALPGEVVAPGDSLRFTYSSARPQELAILSVDGAGKASVYFPDGQETVSVPAAVDAPLPLATALDGVLGKEKVVALFCEHPTALEPVRAALQAAGPGLPEVEGCTLATFHFTKRVP